jgi:hypothetical protein
VQVVAFSVDRVRLAWIGYRKSAFSVIGGILTIASVIGLAAWWEAQGRSWQTAVIVTLALLLAISLRALYVAYGRVNALEDERAATTAAMQKVANYEHLRREGKQLRVDLLPLADHPLLVEAESMQAMMILAPLGRVANWLTQEFGVDGAEALVGRQDAPLVMSQGHPELSGENRPRAVATAIERLDALLEVLANP